MGRLGRPEPSRRLARGGLAAPKIAGGAVDHADPDAGLAPGEQQFVNDLVAVGWTPKNGIGPWSQWATASATSASGLDNLRFCCETPEVDRQVREVLDQRGQMLQPIAGSFAPVSRFSRASIGCSCGLCLAMTTPDQMGSPIGQWKWRSPLLTSGCSDNEILPCAVRRADRSDTIDDAAWPPQLKNASRVGQRRRVSRSPASWQGSCRLGRPRGASRRVQRGA